MIILIPLGGKGQRFKDNNYKKPKSLINIFGEPIINYLLKNLSITCNDDITIYIPYNKEYDKYNFTDYLKKEFPNYKFIFLSLAGDTRGAVETINIALSNIDIYDQPILCLDGDNFYTNDIIKLWNKKNEIFVFKDTTENPIYSYVKLNNEGNIIDIEEKNKISEYACSGAYGFSSYKNLLYYTQKIINENKMQKNEFYTSGVIKEMINDNIQVNCKNISKNFWHCIGTPLQLKQFYNNYPLINCSNNERNVKKKRICFDLDNTLVSFPEIKNDYTTVKPIQKNIDFLKYLKKMNNTIIIYTARRMKTHNGCVGKINADIGKITFDTLDKFNIPYDEIYFGKPHADVYIDDLALNCFDDMEKELGFYNDIINPRSFNSIENDTIEIYTKKSNDLSGEIYYYNNIPSTIKDMFPLLIDFDTNKKWYKIEKINGITLSNIYLSELLTENFLINVMNSIRRIQSTMIENIDIINIYDNYAKKLKSRYLNYNYDKFHNHAETYNTLINFLEKYETEKKGKKCIIHGDTVMTNIIINNNNKIKFIDMRGKCGDILTIYGDWLYDWAKLYQSLIGYDSILLKKNISNEYKNKNINTFINYFLKFYSQEDLYNMKMIAKCLLFSLIPLHDDEKCVEYYNLIDGVI
jgi:capsule biosynthesis phosphatase